jgi:hypothetical protein
MRGPTDLPTSSGPILRLNETQARIPIVEATRLGEPLGNGKGLQHFAQCDDGHSYHLKVDVEGNHSRAVEWLCYRLALRLGMTVPDISVVRHGAETYFGSRNVLNTVSRFQTEDFLHRSHRSAEGMPSPWPRDELARIMALDLFVGNPDRAPHNLLLATYQLRQVLYVIDFGDVRIPNLMSTESNLHKSVTSRHWNLVCHYHQPTLEPALEVLARLGSFSASVGEGILNEIPDDWLPLSVRDGLLSHWASGGFQERASALAALISNGRIC